MLKWLIIGGGLHGTYLSHLLTASLKLPHKRIRVLDDHAPPLAVWRHLSANCGMTHLRSPATHNIDLGIMSLHHFVRARGGPGPGDFIPPYYRPRLSIFNAHCDAVMKVHNLENLRLLGRALSVHPTPRGLIVETSGGPLRTERLILALGVADALCRPAWFRALEEQGAPAHHLFDPAFERSGIFGDKQVVIIGGGISAAQAALALSTQVSRPAALLSRHPLTESQFDFDPCWIGPKCLTSFYEQPYSSRRGIVNKARLPGTLPGEVLDQLRSAVDVGRVMLRFGEIKSASYRQGRIRLKLPADTLSADRLVLATGFDPCRPGGAFVDQLVNEFRLPITGGGYPVVGKDLAWEKRIYVSGALAELQVGPCARNIIGIRNAGKLLLAGLGRG